MEKEEQALEIEFSLKVSDVVRINLYWFPRMPVYVVMIAGLFLFQASQVIPVFLTYKYSVLTKVISVTIIETGFLLLLIALIAIIVVVITLFTTLPAQNKATLTQHRYRFTSETLIRESAYMRVECKWTAIQRINQSSGYIFLWVTQVGMFVNPKRVFSSRAQAA